MTPEMQFAKGLGLTEDEQVEKTAAAMQHLSVDELIDVLRAEGIETSSDFAHTTKTQEWRDLPAPEPTLPHEKTASVEELDQMAAMADAWGRQLAHQTFEKIAKEQKDTVVSRGAKGLAAGAAVGGAAKGGFDALRTHQTMKPLRDIAEEGTRYGTGKFTVGKATVEGGGEAARKAMRSLHRKTVADVGLHSGAKGALIGGGLGLAGGLAYHAHKKMQEKEAAATGKKVKESSVGEQLVEKLAETERERAHRYGVNGALGYGGLTAAANLAHGSPAGALIGGAINGAIGYGGGRLVHRIAHGPATDKKVKKAGVLEKVALSPGFMGALGKGMNAVTGASAGRRALVGAGVGAVGGAVAGGPDHRLSGALVGGAAGAGAGLGAKKAINAAKGMNNSVGRYMNTASQTAAAATPTGATRMLPAATNPASTGTAHWQRR